MQLFASKMTELAHSQGTNTGTSPGQSSGANSVSKSANSEAGGNEKFEVNSGNAFDEHFKESLIKTQSDQAQNSQAKIDQAQLDSSDIVKEEQHADWHELVSQSQSMDTELKNTDSVIVQYTEQSKADINTDSKPELLTNHDESELSVDDKQIDEALLKLLEAQQIQASEATSVVPLAIEPNKLANGVKSALNISPEDTILSSANAAMSETNASLSALSDLDQGSDESKLFVLADAQVELSVIPNTATKTDASAITNIGQTQQSELTQQLNTSEQLAKDQAALTLPSDVEQSILQLSPKQLEQVAQHVFSRLEQGQKNLGDAQQFVSNLKSGLAEIKSQLQDGRVAGIDLSALVQDSLPKTDVIPVKLEQVVQQVSNTLGILGMNAMTATGQVVDTPHTANNVMSSSMEASRQNLEVAVGQLEQTKSVQQTQSSFDKSVNLFKPEGQQQLADKVRWMNNNRQISAELRLDPEDLGAMQVKISMNGDAATVSMVVQSSQARDALEQATPRLREMLAEQGLSLGESSVNQDNSAGKQGGFTQEKGRQNEISTTKIDESIQTGNIIAEQSIRNGSIGGIDYYA